jgi:hypothetical protein
MTAVEPVRLQPNGRRTIRAEFRNPGAGPDLPVKIDLFQLPDGRAGVGVYFTSEDGEPLRGAVLRWDGGPVCDPVLIHWLAPHCKDDECGKPCGHGVTS